MKSADQTVLVWVLALIVSFALGYFALSPLLTAYQDHLATVKAQQIDLENVTQRKTQLDRLGQQLSQRKALLDKLGLAVPNTPQTPELISQINGLAESAGVSLLTIQPARAAKADQGSVVTVTVQGGYPEMIVLAEQIERNLRPAKVTSINFIRTGDESGQITGTLEVRFAQITQASSQGGLL